MGWSCTKAAADTMQAWDDACHKSTGSQNTWNDNGKQYFFETSRTEHSDGAITGTVYRVIERESGQSQCRKSSSFRINGDGTIARAPMFLKRAAEKIQKQSDGFAHNCI